MQRERTRRRVRWNDRTPRPVVVAPTFDGVVAAFTARLGTPDELTTGDRGEAVWWFSDDACVVVTNHFGEVDVEAQAIDENDLRDLFAEADVVPALDAALAWLAARGVTLPGGGA